MKKLPIVLIGLMFGFGKLQAQTLFSSYGITQIQLNDTTFVTVKKVDMGGFYNYYSYKDNRLIADDSTGELFLYSFEHRNITRRYKNKSRQTK